MSDALSAGVAALRSRFIDRTIGQRQRFVALRTAVADDKLSAAELEELRQLCHKLHGAGGTFGMPELSAVAGRAEECCDDLISRPEAVANAPANLAQALDSLLDMLAKLG